MIYRPTENNSHTPECESEFILSCVCDGHLLVIKEIIDSNAILPDDQQIFVAEFYEPKTQLKKPSLLYRIKAAWRMLVIGRYEADGVVIGRSDAIELKEYLEKCLNDYSVQDNPIIECDDDDDY